MVIRLKANPTTENTIATPASTEESATENIIVSLSLKTIWQLPQIAPSSQQDKGSGSPDIALTCDLLFNQVSVGVVVITNTFL